MKKMGLAIFMILFMVIFAFAADFEFETVDEGSVQGQHSSLAIDNEGNPHISFIGESSQSVKYAWFDGDEWTVETVFESFDSIEDTSIALNPAGLPSIAFTNRGTYPDTDIMYASYDGSTWDIASVDQGNYSSGREISLAIDNSGVPAIAYILQNKSDSYYTLKYAKMVNGSWVLDTVHADDYMATSCSLAFSSTNVPYICYAYRNQGVELDYFRLDDQEGWQQETVDPGAEYPGGFTVSMALDSNDRPHFVYNENNAGLLKYSYPYEDVHAAIVTEPWNYGYSSIAVDSNGNVHVAYCGYDGSGSGLKYASYDGESWDIKVADPSEDSGSYLALALDQADQPCISYHDHESQTFDLKYACKNGDNWAIQTVPPAGATKGQYPDLELDSQGEPHLVYMIHNDRAIRYASKDGEEWTISDVASFEELPLGNYFRSPSLAVDEEDLLHVCFASNDVLTYGSLSSNEWEFETVSPDLDVVECDLALDRTGQPHTAFTVYDYGIPSSSAMSPSVSLGRDLFYGTKDENGWSVEKVDDGAIYMSKIILDGGNSPSIGYFDRSAEELRYAYLDNGLWQYSLVSSDIYVYALTMTADDLGNPHMAFTARLMEDVDALEGSDMLMLDEGLFYGTLSGDQWVTAKIGDVNQGYGPRKISIQLDSYGNPHITYGTGTSELGIEEVGSQDDKIELKYACFDGDTWNTVTLAEDYLGGFAMYSDLVFDQNDLPHIAFFTGRGLDYGTVSFTAEEETPASSGGGNCNVGAFPAAFGLLMVPLMFLVRK